MEIGYFIDGTFAISSGTRASAAVMAAATPFALRNGRIVDHAGAVARFDVDGRMRDAMPVSGSEHFTLTRLDPGVRDVGVYIGWAGRWTRAAHAAGGVALARVTRAAPRERRPGRRRHGGWRHHRRGSVRRRSGPGPGPSPSRGPRTESAAILSQARVEGPSPYDLTADLLAWGAAMMLTGRATASGALGPVDAFGFEALVKGCADLGLRRVD